MADSRVFDAGVMNAFLNGAIHVMKTMCRTDPLPGKPGLKGHVLKGDISGTIGLTGEGQSGVFVLSFVKPAALLIVSRMISEEKTFLDTDVRDAVGELTNMVAGSARKNLEGMGKKYEAGIPMVVVGAGHEIYTKISSSVPVISIPFKVDNGAYFTAEFTFDKPAY